MADNEVVEALKIVMEGQIDNLKVMYNHRIDALNNKVDGLTKENQDQYKKIAHLLEKNGNGHKKGLAGFLQTPIGGICIGIAIAVVTSGGILTIGDFSLGGSSALEAEIADLRAQLAASKEQTDALSDTSLVTLRASCEGKDTPFCVQIRIQTQDAWQDYLLNIGGRR